MKKLLALLLTAGLLAGGSPPQAAADQQDTLLVMVFDRGDMDASYGTASNNPWTAYVRQAVERAYGINVEYLAVPRGYADEQLNVMLAAGTAPDIVFTYDYTLWQSACARGDVADLTDSIQTFGEPITEYFGTVLPYGQYQGLQMGIPALRSQVDVSSGFIRKDWLDALGISLARNRDGNYAVTTEQLYGILKAFQRANLGGVAEDDVWGMMSYGTTYWPVLLILEAFYDQTALTDDILAAYPFFLYPGAKEGYRYLNRLLNDGLLYPDFGQIADADKSLYSEYILGGNVGFWTNDAWYGFGTTMMLAKLFELHPEAEVVAVDITNAAGDPAYKYTYNGMGMMVFVPSSCAHPDSAVQYLSWMADPRNYETLIYGFEGEHYTLVNGRHIPIDIAYNNATQLGAADLGILYNGSADADEYFQSLLQELPENQRNLRVQANRVALSNPFSIYPFTEFINAEAEYSQMLNTLEKELRLRCILCSADSFDQVWDSMTARYLAEGGQEVIDAKLKAYAKAHP